MGPAHLIIKDENLDFHPKNTVNKHAKKHGKKVGSWVVAGRKALNDITNKKPLHSQPSTRKINLPKEDFNVKEEMFLHDHTKCIRAQKAAATTNFNFEFLFPQDDSISILEQIKVPDSPRCYPEPVEIELPMSDWLEYTMQWRSPPSSPSPWDSPPSPLAWQNEAVEFVLKEEKNAQV
ncbi:hypothetical protein RJT34_11069 [Clitoria ternatea]|uniref:Uncharacterized protein n=1 Tax=Clitoria ternatea TaxID=43366 RepID=A0AAN9PJP9_CLITE